MTKKNPSAPAEEKKKAVAAVGSKEETAPRPAPAIEEAVRTIAIDDSKAHRSYSSRFFVNATAEEFAIDFVRASMPSRGADDTAVLTIDSKVILSPWAAKRLAIDLASIIQSYEEIYGLLEPDPRKRAVDSAPVTAGTE